MQSRAEYQRARRAALSATENQPELVAETPSVVAAETATPAPQAIESPALLAFATPATVETSTLENSVSGPAFPELIAPRSADGAARNADNAASAVRYARRSRARNLPAPALSLAAVAAAVTVATIAAPSGATEVEPVEEAVIEAHALTFFPDDDDLLIDRDAAASRASSRVDLTEALGDQFEFLDPETLEAAADILSNTELMLLRERGATPERIEEIQAAVEDLRTVLQVASETGTDTAQIQTVAPFTAEAVAPRVDELDETGLPAAEGGPVESIPEPEDIDELDPIELVTRDPNEAVSVAIDRIDTLVSEVELPIPVMEPRALTPAELVEALKVEAQADGARLHSEYAYAFAGMGNGRIPTSMMQTLSWNSSQMLRPDAATQLERLNEAFRAEFGVDMAITSTYRTFAGQVQARARSGMWAATPGTSNHGWGIAVDFSRQNRGIGSWGTAQHNWMQEHAPDFGWIHPDWARRGGSLPEPWHWEFWGTPDPETGELPSPGILRGTETARP